MKSLKEQLKNLIQERGEVSYGDLIQFTIELEYKPATAERRLRYLSSDTDEHKMPQIPLIEPIKKIGKRRGREYVAGYRWAGAPKPKKPTIVFEGNKAVMIYQ